MPALGYTKKYYQEHKDQLKSKSKKRYWARREYYLAQMKKYRQTHPDVVHAINERYKPRGRQHRAEVRQAVLQRLGGKCKCGFSDWRALQIDHINGGGNQACKGVDKLCYYNALLKLPEAELHLEYQILCANCNWIKRYENNEFSKWRKNKNVSVKDL
jgi:hypothetical protein